MRFHRSEVEDLYFVFLSINMIKARFHFEVITEINKFVVYFIIRRNVKFEGFEC